MRILVVEDDQDLNRQIKAALSEAGYAVPATRSTARLTAKKVTSSAIPNLMMP